MAQKRREAKEATILGLLMMAGENGVKSEELNKVAFRYAATIHSLRHNRGMNIITRQRRGTHLVSYVLLGKRGPGRPKISRVAPKEAPADLIDLIRALRKHGPQTVAQLSTRLKTSMYYIRATLRGIPTLRTGKRLGWRGRQATTYTMGR